MERKFLAIAITTFCAMGGSLIWNFALTKNRSGTDVLRDSEAAFFASFIYAFIIEPHI